MPDPWIIQPRRSVGPLMLGMTRQQVNAFSDILGEVYAYDEIVLPSGRIVYKESRDLEAPLITFSGDIVIDISVDHHSKFDVLFNGVSVFRRPSIDLLSAFQLKEGAAYFGLGLVVFPTLAIGTSNFLMVNSRNENVYWEETADKPPRVLTVATANAYDEYMDQYRFITIG